MNIVAKIFKFIGVLIFLFLCVSAFAVGGIGLLIVFLLIAGSFFTIFFDN